MAEAPLYNALSGLLLAGEDGIRDTGFIRYFGILIWVIAAVIGYSAGRVAIEAYNRISRTASSR